MNKIILVGIIIGIIIVSGGLASPLFYENEINEPLPVALDKIEPGMTLESFSSMEDSQRQSIIEKIPDKVRDMIMEESSKVTRTVSENMDEMEDNGVKLIKTGMFSGLAGHQGSRRCKIS